MRNIIPVDQEIVEQGYGDCLRACYATLLSLPIDAVPNFIRHGPRWFLVLQQFLWSVGMEFIGTGHYNSYQQRLPLYEETMKGYVKASVASRVFKGGTHAVIMNQSGLVIHDPSPLKRHQGVNVILSGELHSFDIITPRTDKAWEGWSLKRGDSKG